VWNRIKPCSLREDESDEYISLGVDADEDEKYGEAAASQRIPYDGMNSIGGAGWIRIAFLHCPRHQATLAGVNLG